MGQSDYLAWRSGVAILEASRDTLISEPRFTLESGLFRVRGVRRTLVLSDALEKIERAAHEQ
jgi:hypothetical protein